MGVKTLGAETEEGLEAFKQKNIRKAVEENKESLMKMNPEERKKAMEKIIAGSLEGFENQSGEELALNIGNTVVQTALEKAFGAPAQLKRFKTTKDFARAFLGGFGEEFATENMQNVTDAVFDKIGNRFAEDETVFSRIRDNFRDTVVAGMFGGTAGTAFAIYNRSKGIKEFEDLLRGTDVNQEKINEYATSLYDSGVDNIQAIVSKELEMDSSLKARYGETYDSLRNEIIKQVEDVGAFKDVSEEKKAQYIEESSKMFADQVVGESMRRNTTIDDIIKANEIIYKDGRLYLQGISQQTKLKRLKEKKIKEAKQPSLLQFIRLNGGIMDEGGELKNMDAAKQFIGLVNKKGSDIDTMGESLWQAGYFMERPTPAEVLEYIDDELRGVKHYPLGYVEQKGIPQAENESRLDSEISEYADIMGYNLDKMGYDEKQEIYEQMQKNLYGEELGMEQPETAEDFGFTDNEFFQVADENARLDDIYPAYDGKTITINGKERTVYNSNGERIAKSKEALENFYKWFGDSKVVDEQGRPLVVYHGSDVQFNTFDIDKIGKYGESVGHGFYFANKSIAERYNKGYLYSVYLKMEKPVDYLDSNKIKKSQIEDIADWYNDNFIETEDGHRIFVDNLYYLLKNKAIDSYKISGILDFAEYNELDMGKAEVYQKIYKKLKEITGIDGFYQTTDVGTVWVAFNPNQIKSTENRGTYSESPNIYHQFAGEKAQTAALDELNKAKQLDADGVDNEEIRQQTGWFKGADGKWRFEISDKDAVLNEGFATKGSKIFMSVLLEHEKLYEAYPELGSVLVEFIDDANVDYFGRHIPETFLQDESIIINLANVDKGRIKSVLMHEIQHTIQDTENFAFGGSPETVTQEIRDIADSLHYKKLGEFEEISDKANRLADVLEVYRFSENPDTILKSHVLYEHGSPFSMPSKKDKKARKEYRDFLYDTWWQDMQEKYESRNDWEFFDLVRDGNVKEIKKQYYSLRAKAKRLLDKADTKALRTYEKLVNDIDNGNISSMDAYRRLYGEVEARNTQSRMDLTEEQRKATTPESTQDVANADAIVIFDGKPMAYIPETYNQIKNLPKQKGKIKGAFDALTKSIEITSEADFSTYQHEFAHYWLDNIWNYAQSGKASERYMKQFNEIKKWLGVKPEQTYLTRQQHEKFARGYEKWLFKGTYPTPIIGDVFKEYENFIKEVYDSIAEIDTRAGAKYKPVPKVVYDFFNSMVTGTLPYTGEVESPKETVEKETKEVKEYVKEEQKVLAENTENYLLKPVQTDTKTGYLTAYKKMTGEEIETGSVTLENEMEKAEKFVSENPDLAKQIVDGVAPVPDGMLKNTIYIAYDNLQKKLGNTKNRANSLMNQALELRRMGQEISSQRLAYRDGASPLSWIQAVQESKASALADSNRMQVRELNDLIDKSIKDGMNQGKTAKEIAKDLREQLGVTEFYQEEVYKTYETDESSYNYIYKYVNQQLGLSLTEEQAETITRKADDMLSDLENSKAENGNPSVEYFVKEKDLENYANSIAPSSQARIIVSVVGRGNLLFSIKSPLTNVISNTFVGVFRAATRRIMLGQYTSIVDPELIKQNKQYSWEIFRKTGYNVNNMTPETPRNTILGEKLTHSEGAGNIRKLGRFYENLIYKWSLGAGDVIFKDYAFTDYVALKATKESKGNAKVANEIFKDACLIEPQTDLGKEIRAEAIQESLIATYQNKGLISEKALKARESLDFGVGFGEFIAPFVKTPANVVGMGLKAGFGSVKAIASEIRRDLRAGKIQPMTKENIDLVVQNGLGLLLAAMMLSFIDDDEYMPPYAIATNKDKQLAKELNISYNSIRIGNTWISLDYLGPLASPLVGLLQARREDGVINKIFGYSKSGAIQSLSIPAFGNIADIFTNVENMVRKEGADVAAETLNDTIQAVYSRTIPSIVSDVAKMLDKYDRETKGHEIKAKIPLVRESLPKKVNVTSGRAESLDSPINELLFGARAKTQVVNPVVKELQRLNNKGYGVSLTPVTQRGLLSGVDEKTKEKVRNDFAKEYSSQVKKLIDSPSYKRMHDEDKKNAIDKIRRKTVESLKKRYLKK